jgi:hypothetical protein
MWSEYWFPPNRLTEVRTTRWPERTGPPAEYAWSERTARCQQECGGASASRSQRGALGPGRDLEGGAKREERRLAAVLVHRDSFRGPLVRLRLGGCEHLHAPQTGQTADRSDSRPVRQRLWAALAPLQGMCARQEWRVRRARAAFRGLRTREQPGRGPSGQSIWTCVSDTRPAGPVQRGCKAA